MASLAGKIADKAWRGKGVRAFVLPDRSLVVVPIEGREDDIMLRRMRRYWLATWCVAANGRGPTFQDILTELRDAIGEGQGA